MVDPSAPTDQVYAGFWIRVLAALIDSVLVSVVAYPILIAVYGWSSIDAGALANDPLGTLLQSLLETIRQTVFEWVFATIAIILFWMFRSATPGKIIVGARIVDARTGGRPSKAQCIGRYFGYFVSIFPLCLGLIWVGIDKRKQGWHDKLAGTVVIRERKPRPPR
jgi:uncharacterized RDD family membrane protein YckC